MLKFSEFILERWRKASDKGGIDHDHDIGGHKVKVMYRHIEGKTQKHGGHYTVDFSVDGSTKKHHTMDPKTGKQVLSHVHKSLNHFVSKKKPGSVTVFGATTKQHGVYQKAFNKLATKTGGKTSHDDISAHVSWKKLNKG